MIGTRLADRYELVAELGRGGMAVVYRAHDPRLDREVAIKVIATERLAPAAADRFQREAELIAGLDHPSIVPVFDFGRHGRWLFLVMPILRGANLHELMRRRRLLLNTTLEVAARAAEALAYSAARGIVHRDVKPENLMVALDENDRLARLWVMDFGLAVGEMSTRLTRTGSLPGTLAYLSPEQIVTGDAEGRSDLYSLGVILYECLAGKPPFTGSPASVLYRIVNEQPPSLMPHGIDERLEALVLRCLAKAPSERFQDGDELAAALREHARHLLPEGRLLPQLAREGEVEPLPLVGRERETTAIDDALTAALGGTCQLMLIGGERGLGTSRLAGEAAAVSRRRGFQVLRGRFSNQAGGVSYEAFGELIFDFFTQRRSSTSVGHSPIPALADLGPELLRIFPVLREIPELGGGATYASQPTPETPAPATGPTLAATQEEPRHVFELIARTLSRLAGERPQTLVIEQLQEADVSIQLLLYLVRRLSSTRTFILGTYRPSGTSRSHPLRRLIRGLAADPRCHHLLLEALDERHHRELVQNLLGGGEVQEQVSEQLYEVTGGNPLFAQEVVRALWDAGDLELGADSCWRLAKGDVVFSRELPETVQQAVTARIERLGERVIDVIGTASVLGRRFFYQDLEGLWTDGDEEELEEHVEILIQRRLLAEVPRTRGDQLSFESPLVREVVYARLPRRRRRRLHRRFALRLEKRAGTAPDRWLAELLHHFAEGDVPERAVHYGRLQALRALENHCFDDALDAAQLALEFIDDVAHAEAELRLILAEAYAGRGHPDAAMREAARAVESFQARGDRKDAARATVTLVEVAWKYRRMEAVARWLETGLALARGALDQPSETPGTELSETMTTLLHLAATAANLRGEVALAQRFLAESRRLSGDPDPSPGGEQLAPAERLRIGVIGNLTTLDPASATSVPEAEILANIFEPLFEIGPAGRIVPRLARSLSSDADLRSYTVQLRGDRYFSDGSMLDAESAKRSLEAAVRSGARRLRPMLMDLVGGAEFLAGERSELEGLRVTGELELRFDLEKPAPLLPAMLSALGTAVAARRDGAVLGTGLYRLAAHEGHSTVLEQNDYHPLTGAEAPRSLEFIAMGSSRQVASALVDGEIELGRDLAVPEIENFLARPTFYRSVHEKASPNIAFLMFNRHGPASRDPKLRRILAGVLDPRETVWRALGRFALPAGSWIPPGMLGHDAGASGPRRLDRFEALGLLQDLEHPPQRLRIFAHPIFRQRFRAVLESIVNEWSMLGLALAVEELPLGDLKQLREAAREADVLFSRWYPDYSDPDAYTHGAFSTEDGFYGAFAGAPELDRLLEQARRTVGPGKRDRLYRRIQRQMVHEDVIVPLFHDVDFRVSSPAVGGVQMLAGPPYVDYKGLGLRQCTREEPPRPVGRLRIPLQEPIAHFDPARQVGVQALELMAVVFETLTRIDRRGSVVPHLAESIESREGGRVHRFHLRQALFHDGRRLRSQDVRAAFERLLRHDRPHLEQSLARIEGAGAFQIGATDELTGFVIRSDSTFELRLVRAIEHFPVFLSDPTLGIVPEGTEVFDADWRRGCVGTGPFMVIDFEPGRRIEMRAFRDYWRAGRPRSQGLVFELLGDGVPVGDELRAGRVHVTSELRAVDVDSLASDARFAGGLHEHPAFTTFFMLFNRVQGPLTQVEVRRELARHLEAALPKVNSRLGRLGVPAKSFIPPGLMPAVPGRPAWSRTEPSPFDGLVLETALHPLLSNQYREFWQALTDELATFGIELKTYRTGSLDEISDLVSRRMVDVVAGRWVGDAPDPSSFAGVVHSDEGAFGRLLCHEQVDRLVERGAETEENRHLVYAELERVLAEEVLLWPLFHQQICCASHPDVEGLRLGYGWPTVRYDELSLRR